MPKIQILDDVLASQVAAGEVVERPASVVKELVENSLDAGARHITVEIQKGGTALIKVADDACGMSREDALMSLERHATSKLRTSSDLSSVLTLGFRGEAVPSIASISRFRMMTCEKGEVSGTELVIDGGVIKDVRDAGVAEGTTIEVKQIFFNVPARQKFLRAETTEAAHVEHQVRLHALASPGVRFTYIKDGRSVFDLAGTSDWRVRISGLSGSEIAGDLIEVRELAFRDMKVRGYLLPADYARKGRRQQFIFLNGRPIEDTAISRALRDGYRGSVSDGNHPAAWLWLDMDPALVDVNVHPAKREVRFHRPHDVRDLILDAIVPALYKKPAEIEPSELAEIAPVSTMGVIKSEIESDLASADVLMGSVKNRVVEIPEVVEQSSVIDFPHQEEEQDELLDESGVRLAEQPHFNLIGPLHDRYIVMEGDEGVVLLDPVAARERVVYECLIQHAGASELDEGAQSSIESQGLLVPELFELDSIDADLVIRHAAFFLDAGIHLEAFGGSTVKVSSLPSFLQISDIRGFLLGLVDELSDTSGAKTARKGKLMAHETFAASMAKRVGRYEPCRIDHAEVLLNEMFKCDLPYCTPDGRPTVIHISLSELDRKFGK